MIEAALRKHQTNCPLPPTTNCMTCAVDIESIKTWDETHRVGALMTPSLERITKWEIPPGRRSLVDIADSWGWKVSRDTGNTNANVLIHLQYPDPPHLTIYLNHHYNLVFCLKLVTSENNMRCNLF